MHSRLFPRFSAHVKACPFKPQRMYVELHTRSAFSFLEGASLPEELAEVCHSHQMPAMALLDRDGVYGAARFHLAMKKLGLQAHIGAEVTSLLPPVPLMENSALPRVSLLCTSREGYQNLCRLVTRMKLRAPKYPASLPRQAKRAATDELLMTSQAVASTGDLSEFSSGLICMTGGEEGPLACALAHGGMQEARRTLEQLVAIYGHDNVYMELQRHYDRAQESRNQAAIDLARSLKLPLLATQGAHQDAAGDVTRVLRSSRNHCQHSGTLFTPRFHAQRSRLQVSQLSRARGRDHEFIFAGAHIRGSTRALPASRTKRFVAASAAADRTRAHAHRAT